MVFSLTSTQEAELQALRNTFPTTNDSAYSQSLNYYEMYELLLSYIDAYEAGNNTLTGDEQITKIWLEGVIDVNKGVGAQSDFIRNYNSAQNELRYGNVISSAAMDKASDDIALSVINEVLLGDTMPDISQLAAVDVATVSQELLNDDPSAWAGNILLPYLGYGDAFDENIIGDGSDAYNLLAAAEVSYNVLGGITTIGFDFLAVASGGIGFLWDENVFGLMWEAEDIATQTGSTGVVAAMEQSALAMLSELYSIGSLGLAEYIVTEDLDLGTMGNDILNVDSGDDHLVHGGAGNDVIAGNSGDDILDGGAGDDNILGGTGNDILDGGSGNDTVDYSSSSTALVIDIQEGYSLAESVLKDNLHNIENVIGSSHNDLIYGDAGDNQIEGSSGNDVIHAGDGFDTLIFNGNFGNDTVTGGELLVIDGVTIEGGEAGLTASLDASGLLLNDGTNSVLLQDWSAHGDYGINLLNSDFVSDPDARTVEPALAGTASATTQQAWYKVEHWYTVEKVALASDYIGTPSNSTNSNGYFPLSVFTQETQDFINAHRYSTQWGGNISSWQPYSQHSSSHAPELGQYDFNVHGFFLNGEYTGGAQNQYLATSGTIVIHHERVTEVIDGPGVTRNSLPDVSANLTGPSNNINVDAISVGDGDHTTSFHDFYWLYGSVDLSGGVSSLNMHNDYAADDDGDVIFAGNGNDTITSGAGDDLLDGGKGFDIVNFTGDYGADTVTGAEQIVVDGVVLDGSQTGFTYSYGSLLIEDSNGNSIYLADWEKDGDYGITLGQHLTGTLTGNVVAERMTYLDVGDYQLVDFTGDGQVDIISENGTYGAGLVVIDGASGDVTRLSSVSLGDYRLVDFDGDGSMDIVSDYLGGLGWYSGGDLGQFNRITYFNVGNYEIGDFNGDGQADVVSSKPLYTNGAPIGGGVWFDGTNGAMNRITYNDLGSFKLADLDGNGLLDIVASGSYYSGGTSFIGGTVTYEYNPAGVSAVVRHSFISDDAFQIVQMDGDAQLELIANQGAYTNGAPASGVVLLEGNALTSRYNYYDVGDYVATDVDGDGQMEIVGTQGAYQNGSPLDGIIAYEADGSVWRYGDRPYSNVDDLSLTDWDGDGHADVVAQGGVYGNGLIYYVAEGRDDTLAGSIGGDTIDGGRGNDQLTGNSGADTFQFTRGHGNDTITDFELGIDTLAFGNVFGITSAQDVLDATSYAAGNATISTLEGIITLTGISAGLTLSDIEVI